MEIRLLRNAGVKEIFGILTSCGVALGLGGCLVERTVTDGSGALIYQEPEVHMPFESEQQKDKEVERKERELGWQ